MDTLEGIVATLRICPVCGLDRARRLKCPACGWGFAWFSSDWDLFFRNVVEYRHIFVRTGMHWDSTRVPQPPDWNPAALMADLLSDQHPPDYPLPAH